MTTSPLNLRAVFDHDLKLLIFISSFMFGLCRGLVLLD